VEERMWAGRKECTFKYGTTRRLCRTHSSPKAGKLYKRALQDFLGKGIPSRRQSMKALVPLSGHKGQRRR
jgi:hypothetical protein